MLDMRLFHQGSKAWVWMDHKQGIVMKRCFSPEVWMKEWKIGQGLQDLPWIVRILGRSSESHRQVIFMVYEGEPVSDDEWEELEPILRSWVRILHSRGVHHHDIAARNVLRSPDGKLTLIDFGLTAECQGGEDCPDINLEETWFA